MSQNDKPFDCIAYKREAQARIAQETAGMNHEEELRHYETRAETGPLAEWWKRVKASRRKPGAAA